VRSGIVVHSWKWSAIHDLICQFKTSRFLKWDAEIKGNHLRTAKGAFSGWDESARRNFLNDFLDTIGREIDVTILWVRIEKAKVDLTRRDRLTNPSVRSLELLLELYNTFLGHAKDKTGGVVLDSVNYKNDSELRYFQNYLRTFSDHLDHRRIIDGTFFLGSHESSFLQIADVVANVMFVNDPGEVARLRHRVWGWNTWP
jgi:hypothetical protein